MEPASNQVGWVSTVGELYYGLNPISLDDSRITFLESLSVRMTYVVQGQTMATTFISQVVTVKGLTLHDHIIMTLDTLY